MTLSHVVTIFNCFDVVSNSLSEASPASDGPIIELHFECLKNPV